MQVIKESQFFDQGIKNFIVRRILVRLGVAKLIREFKLVGGAGNPT